MYTNGKAEGEAKGQREAAIQIAKKMLAKKISLTVISQVTGLAVEDINALIQG